MAPEFVSKIGSRVILTLIVIIAYTHILHIGDWIAKFMGFGEMTIYQLVVAITYSSIVVFFITLTLNLLFQIIPFFSDDSFTRTFYSMYMFFLYVSGLLVTLVSIQPILINRGYITSIINNEISQVFILLFFIILSNYYLYDVIIIQNKLKLIQEDGVIRPVLLYRIFLFIFSVSWMFRLLVVGFDDQINVIWGFLVVAPSVINRLFFNNPYISWD